jgi:hypothetical protein
VPHAVPRGRRRAVPRGRRRATRQVPCSGTRTPESADCGTAPAAGLGGYGGLAPGIACCSVSPSSGRYEVPGAAAAAGEQPGLPGTTIMPDPAGVRYTQSARPTCGPTSRARTTAGTPRRSASAASGPAAHRARPRGWSASPAGQAGPSCRPALFRRRSRRRRGARRVDNQPRRGADRAASAERRMASCSCSTSLTG